jgi:hypothetical protein
MTQPAINSSIINRRPTNTATTAEIICEDQKRYREKRNKFSKDVFTRKPNLPHVIQPLIGSQSRQDTTRHLNRQMITLSFCPTPHRRALSSPNISCRNPPLVPTRGPNHLTLSTWAGKNGYQFLCMLYRAFEIAFSSIVIHISPIRRMEKESLHYEFEERWVTSALSGLVEVPGYCKTGRSYG